MWYLGTSGGLGSIRLTAALNDLKGLFQPKQFYDSMHVITCKVVNLSLKNYHAFVMSICLPCWATKAILYLNLMYSTENFLIFFYAILHLQSSLVIICLKQALWTKWIHAIWLPRSITNAVQKVYNSGLQASPQQWHCGYFCFKFCSAGLLNKPK